jgi:hypothetical protein
MTAVPYDGNVKPRERIEPADLPEAWNKAAEVVKKWQGIIPAEFYEEYKALKHSRDLYGVRATMYPVSWRYVPQRDGTRLSNDSDVLGTRINGWTRQLSL